MINKILIPFLASFIFCFFVLKIFEPDFVKIIDNNNNNNNIIVSENIIILLSMLISVTICIGIVLHVSNMNTSNIKTLNNIY